MTMMIATCLAVLFYVVIALAVGVITYSVSNPYGHFSAALQWVQTLLCAVFWPILLIYLLGVWFYYELWRGD